MDQANPVIIALLFVVRCVVPLLVMLGISYLLRRMGLIKEPPPPPYEYEHEDENNNNQEGIAHGKV